MKSFTVSVLWAVLFPAGAVCQHRVPMAQQMRPRIVKPITLTPAQEAVVKQICGVAKTCKELPPGCPSREQLAADLVAIGYHESGLRPRARNPNGGAMGCFQFLRSTMHLINRKGWAKGDWRGNPATSARMTLKLLQQGQGTYDQRILQHNIGTTRFRKLQKMTPEKRARALRRIDGGASRVYVARVKARSQQLKPIVSKYMRGKETEK